VAPDGVHKLKPSFALGFGARVEGSVLERKVIVLLDPSDPRVVYADGWMPQLWSAISGQRPTCFHAVHEKEVVWLESCKVGGGPPRIVAW
jgi:hypothetical protein